MQYLTFRKFQYEPVSSLNSPSPSGECTSLQPRSPSWNVLLVVWLQWKKYASHEVKFRKLQINYILIFLRKIFQLKTAQSQRAFHFEANFVFELKAYDTSWQFVSFYKHCCAAPVGEWNKGFIIQRFFMCGILEHRLIRFSGSLKYQSFKVNHTGFKPVELTLQL